MMTAIQINATDQAIAQYRKLLRSDWSRETLADTLALLGKLIMSSAHPALVSWQETLGSNGARGSGKGLNADVLRRIGELATLFAEPSIPPMPSRFSSTKTTRLTMLAEKAWTYLILQALAEVHDGTGLFADTQSLLFLSASHFLLPQLKQQGLKPEHDCLVCAMHAHALLVWRNEPAHLYYLQSVLMDCLEKHERRLELLNLSFRLTSPDDHAYLTRATAYWSDLMNQDRRTQARDFLLNLNRYSPPSCQDEIAVMLTETLSGAKHK